MNLTPESARSLDEQMATAVHNQFQHAKAAHSVDRRGWPNAQWVADAQRLMCDLDGSVLDLLNGHVLALFEAIDELAKQRKAVSDLHRPHALGNAVVCVICRLDTGEPEPYPCPTRKAIKKGYET